MGEFEEAVEWILPHVSEMVRDRKLDVPSLNPSEFYLKRRLVKEDKSASGATIWSMSEDDALLLVRMAEKDAGAFDLAKKVAMSNIRYATLPPSALRSFVIEILEGATKRPKESRRNKNWLRNAMFNVFVREVVIKYKLRPTRNDENVSKNSACDVVVEALGRCSHTITYKTIKEVCSGPKSDQIYLEYIKCVTGTHRSSLFEPLGWDGEQ